MIGDSPKRRREDTGGESSETILGRIDERLKNIVEKMTNDNKSFNEHKEDFKKHIEEDDRNFRRIDKTIYICSGVIMAVIFVAKIIFR